VTHFSSPRGLDSTRFALFSLLLCAAVACKPPAAPKSLKAGHAALELAVDGKTLTFKRDAQTLLTFHADSFQVGTVDTLETGDSFDPFWLEGANAAMPGGFEWRSVAAGGVMKLVSATDSTLTIELALNGGKGQVAFKKEADDRFSAVLTATITDGQSIAYLRLRPDADATEAFYGLGEWGDSVNHRGKLRPMQMEVDTSVEGGVNEDHAPVPLLIGTRGWGLFAQSRRPGVFDVARKSSTLIDVIYGTAKDSGDGLTFHLFSAAEPLDVQKLYYDVAGYPGLPATWAYGPLIWRNENLEAAQVQTMDDIQKIRSLHLATTGIWFDRPYATGVETFDFKPSRYPDPLTMFHALHDAGLRYGVWHAPYLGGAASEDPATDNLAEANAGGYFPPLVGGGFNNWGKALDFTNPAAYSWWQSKLHKYTDSLEAGGYGIEGFKLDYAEDVQLGVFGARLPWLFHDGSDELTMHYGYTMLYHKVYREMLPAEGGFLLTRTGRWGDQVRGMIIWPGDLDASFAKEHDQLAGDNQLAVGGLPAALIKGLSLSASGFPFYASDTGGYKHSSPDKETFLRWLEANTISAAMEVGDASGVTPWEYAGADHYNDATVLTDYAKYALLHLRLFPYAWTYAKNLATTGRPLLRPFGLAFPQLNKHPDDQFMFGDSILSAPVVEVGKTAKHVVLPPGVWFGWWDGQPHDGGTAGTEFDVPADLHTLPLFLAAGGIVPMLRDNIETLSPVAAGSAIESYANDAGVLWARVAPGSNKTSFKLYDGTELGQQSGSGQVALTYTPGPSAVFGHGAMFEVISAPSVTSVMNGGTALTQQASLEALKTASEGWFRSTDTNGTLWIKVASAASITAH
jgi:alpha-D-xyloside xylohydrolase